MCCKAGSSNSARSFRSSSITCSADSRSAILCRGGSVFADPPFLFCVKALQLLISVVLIAASEVGAQHAGHTIPVIPNDLLERTINVREGIGTTHDRVATKSAEAQRSYDQGLAYPHSYVWIEAARSFNQALRFDRALAVAHAGLSVALVELNKADDARAAIDRARAMAGGLADHDRRHVELRGLQFDAEVNPRDTTKLTAYRRALDAAIAAFPSDLEFVLLRGMAESNDPAERGQGTGASSIPYFEKAAASFAGQHYLAHAYENSGRSDAALKAAEAYAKAAPAIPHAHHMYGHNLRRTGQTWEAIAQFRTADRLHRDYLKLESVAAEYDWHFAHNLDLLASSYQYIGQINRAAALRKESFDLPSNLVVQVYNKHDWPSFLRGRGRMAEALAAAQLLIRHPHPLVEASGHIEAGYVMAAGGRWGDAANESNTALRILRTAPEGAPMAAPALLGLQGEIALRTGEREKGRRMLLDVAARVRALPGPDGWVQALFVLESLARTARQVGDWQLAGDVAQQMLAHDPLYAGSHYAAALVAEHDDDKARAKGELTIAQKDWSQADADLSELADIKKRLKELQ
jgi:tetratricopeptide (TPR) repeat protein